MNPFLQEPFLPNVLAGVDENDQVEHEEEPCTVEVALILDSLDLQASLLNKLLRANQHLTLHMTNCRITQDEDLDPLHGKWSVSNCTFAAMPYPPPAPKKGLDLIRTEAQEKQRALDQYNAVLEQWANHQNKAAARWGGLGDVAVAKQTVQGGFPYPGQPPKFEAIYDGCQVAKQKFATGLTERLLDSDTAWPFPKSPSLKGLF